MTEVATIIQIMLLGYALGSIPVGVLLAKAFRLPDPRTIGSGNIGATNMLRMGNKKIALLTLLLDAGKGAAAVMLAAAIFTIYPERCVHDSAMTACPPYAYLDPRYAPTALLAAVLGHMYSPWLKFKGGKGVATLLGGGLAFSWPVGLGAFIIWAIVMFMKRIVSLASIVALGVAPLIVWLRVDGTSAFILAIAASIAIWKHRENIKRLRHGFEPKISFGRDKNHE